jgi:rhombotail lipoprotein
MKKYFVLLICAAAVSIFGCAIFEQSRCSPGCHSETQQSSSLVNFLYPDGKLLPPNNSIPELKVPLRVGLAFLPSQSSYGTPPLEPSQKNDLLQRIRDHFASRKFVSEIVIIPDYYLANVHGFAGLDGVQRLYNIDVMALVSYDQITHTDDNKLSLGYLTIVGAYVLRGSSHDTATLVDLAVIDPATRSLILRAGGTDTQHGNSTLIDVNRDTRHASANSFEAATVQMIGNFDVALTSFENDVHAGKANVRVVSRNGSGGGGGAMSLWALFALAGVLVMRTSRQPVPIRHAAGACSPQ